MLFVHEVHTVHGRGETEFEDLYRQAWMSALATGDDARLLWYLHHTHGTGPAYTVVTVTGVRDAAAWGRLLDRLHGGDLTRWAEAVDGLRHSVQAKVLRPVAWSPVQDLDLDTVPTDPAAEHEAVLFMEDTAWPHPGKLDDYLERAGTQYAGSLSEGDAKGTSILRLRAAFQPVWGTGRRREVVLWQEVARPELLQPLFTREIPPEKKAPGTWMHDALELRDQWESRLLRSAPWSPLT
jgi:hypothetical protein